MSLASAHFTLGRQFEESEKLLDAERCYRSAIKADADFAEACAALERLPVLLINRGVVLQRDGALAAAEEMYRAALRLMPDLQSARTNLIALAYAWFEDGVSHVQEGVSLAAIESYRHAVACGFPQVGATLNLGILLREQGRLTEAIVALETATDFEPDDYFLWRMLADVREQAGELAASRDALLVARRLGAWDWSLERKLADILAQLDEPESALTILDALVLRDPDRVAVQRDRTALLIEMGRTAEVTASLQRALALGLHWPGIHEQLEKSCFAAEEWEGAIAANDAAYRDELQRQEEEARGGDVSALLHLRVFLVRHREIARERAFFRQSDPAVHDCVFDIEPALAMETFRRPEGSSQMAFDRALAGARAAIAGPAAITGKKRLVAAILARDESDVLADTIACHLNQGVDLVMVTDNGSVDGTRQLLAELEANAPVVVLDEAAHTHSQALWMSRMVHWARDRYGAEWVLCCDADEVWLAEERDLAAAIARDAAFYGAETRQLLCHQSLMLPDRATADADGYRATDARLALRDPLRRLPLTAAPDKQYYRPLHKTIVRTDGFAALWHGNHYGVFSGATRYGQASSIEVLHFHARSREQVRRKEERVLAAVAGNPSYDAESVRRRATADMTYDAGSYPTPFWVSMRQAGRLVSLDAVSAIRDRTLPPRPDWLVDPSVQREQAKGYFAAIEPHLPRGGVLR